MLPVPTPSRPAASLELKPTSPFRPQMDICYSKRQLRAENKKIAFSQYGVHFVAER